MFKTYEKMNLAIMKNEMKRSARKNYMQNVFMAGDDGFIYCCIDGFRMYRIVKDDFLLDIEKLPGNKNLQDIYTKVRNECNFELYYTGTTIISDGKKLAEFGSNDHTYIYYNEKFLQEFGKLEDLILKANSETNPAIISSAECNYVEIGLICPARR